VPLASAAPVTAPVVNEPEVAEGYAAAMANAPVAEEVAPEPVVDLDRPLRRKKT
jgi:hypothetical protein